MHAHTVSWLWLIPFLPLLGAAWNGFFGKPLQTRWGNRPISAVACGSVILSFVNSDRAQVRAALDDYLERVESQDDDGILHADDPIFQMIGMFSSKEGDLSVNHDHYLYGWPKREPASAPARPQAQEKRTVYKAKRKKSASVRRPK